MSTDHLHAEIVDDDGRRFLFWLERDGERLTFHQLTTARGVGTVDLRAHITPGAGVTDDAAWAHLTEDGFPALCIAVLNEIRPLEEVAHG